MFSSLPNATCERPVAVGIGIAGMRTVAERLKLDPLRVEIGNFGRRSRVRASTTDTSRSVI